MGRQGDTIAAVATPAGPGAIGILRLSGPRAADIAAACFRPLGQKGLLDHLPRTLVYGSLLDCEGQVIDQVLCTYSRGPSSYTGEDTAELHCHGSPMVLSLGLEALFAQGARQAGPGEFTQRAFLNGRLDLAQAEGVADLLDARSREGARQAAGQLSGALSRRIASIYSALVDVMAHFHAVLDYPDEDIDPFTQEQLARDLRAQQQALKALLSTYQRGRRLNQGVKCAIVGRPNAGKSSLLNALAGYDRAIVTDIPGTTRDTVEETVELGGVPLRLIDTAGLRDSSDPIEQLGVERSRRAMEEAELILVVLDQSRPAGGEDTALIQAAVECAPTIVVLNKRDLPGQLEWTEQPNLPASVLISAKTGSGLDDLANLVAQAFPRDAGSGYGELLTNQRQAEAAGRALESVRRAEEALSLGITPDALLLDVEEALSALGELTGQSVRDDVTDRIFQRFCVGK
ncbi:MAG: tRNA uridine-5-carboxymethylaminomethyl(34) synthesis GTPase MnmE [Oscillospiraceae bacterium]|jgi:tRNA modification GTPase|nr:tRNA uridine-5-carboxymethylaminomethyl(34) synthesis GTPase MnmE [Oscillospiraceae bacterium]